VDPLIGARIDGRYTVRGKLGHGGMGVVYDGVHDELGRSVAIKVLNAAWAADPTAVARFLREARTAGSFTHGNIVDVSDLGRLPDGRPYLVMPKIAGIDLATLLRESGAQPPKRVAELLLGVGAALDLIHAKGLVHRDIKPENLMYVVREDGSETVMLLDFGIAALVASNEPRITRRGSIFGTPEYLPPEVWDGKLPDRRGDVYALATVAFELMTGVLPFTAENVMQILPMKLKSNAPSMASASAMSFAVEIEAVIARGLAREPSDRYDTASALIAALKDATARVPVSWRPGVVETKHQTPLRPTALERDSGADLEEPLPANAVPVGLSPMPGVGAGHAPRAVAHSAVVPSQASLRLPLSGSRRWIAGAAAAVVAVLFLVAWWALDSDPQAHLVSPAKPIATQPPQQHAPAPPEPAPAAAAEAPPPVVETPPPTANAAIPPTEPVTTKPAPTAPSSRKTGPAHARHPTALPTPTVDVKPVVATHAPTPPAVALEPSKPAAPAQATSDPRQAAQQLTREGTSALLGGQVGRALELLRRATQTDPALAAAWRSYGLALERAARSREAIDAYQRYLRIEPRGPQADKVRERIAALRN
jgi:serine/threonine-protein kinase